MDEFLRGIAKNINEGNSFLVEDYYMLLKYYGVSKDTSLALDIEKYYNDFLEGLENSLVKYHTNEVGNNLNKTNYIGFYVDEAANYLDAAKVYFSVKYEYVVSALKTVFTYLIRNNIKSTVKFHLKNTNENIVIRFYNKDEVKPFIDYVNNSFVLTDLLGPVNPFIATKYGIGIVRDDNIKNSYNGSLAEHLNDYFNYLKENELLANASGIDFLDFLIKKRSLINDERSIFNINSIIDNIKAIINKETDY